MLSRATASLERTTELINSQYPKDAVGRLVIFDASLWSEAALEPESEAPAEGDDPLETVNGEEVED